LKKTVGQRRHYRNKTGGTLHLGNHYNSFAEDDDDIIATGYTEPELVETICAMYRKLCSLSQRVHELESKWRAE